MKGLSIQRYAGLCILGGEVAYAACLLYGATLTGSAAELHHSFFELLPGFTWINVGSIIAGAVTVAVWSGIGGAYVAWMHNRSIV